MMTPNGNDFYIYSNIYTVFFKSLSIWYYKVFDVSRNLMFTLAGIHITWKGIQWMAGRDEIEALWGVVLKELIMLSFFFMFFQFTNTWLPMLINSLMDIGRMAGSQVDKLNPVAVVEQGLHFWWKILKASQGFGLLTDMVGALTAFVCGIFIFFAYLYIACEMIVTMIIAYYMVAVSPLFVSVSVTDWFRPITMNFVRGIIGVGIKLMCLYSVVGIGITLGNQWIAYLNTAEAGGDWKIYLIVAGAAFIFWRIAMIIPDTIASLAGYPVVGTGNLGGFVAGLVFGETVKFLKDMMSNKHDSDGDDKEEEAGKDEPPDDGGANSAGDVPVALL